MESAHPTLFDQPPDNSAAKALDCLQRGGAVVAANPRAARELRRHYGLAQTALGKAAWTTPLIYDWDSWLGILWKEHLLEAGEAPLLISALQEKSVWMRIIGTQTDVHEIKPESIAALAADAWRLLCDFGVRDECKRSWQDHATADAETFRQWAQIFERECRRKQWLSLGGLPAVLAQSIRQGTIAVPAKVLLIGFDRIVPAQQQLIEAAQAAGCTLTLLETPHTTNLPWLLVAKEPNDEIDICAWWARRKLESHPTARIAVIVQDIEGSRGEIERTFHNVLMPESVGIESNEMMPFEFSLGRPLGTVPLIKTALLLLRWLEEPLHHNEIAWMMMSGFFSVAEDAAQHADEMAALDVEIRSHGKLPPEISLAEFSKYKARTTPEAVRRWFGTLRRLQQIIADRGTEKTFPDWLNLSEKLLRRARWPSGRTLDSVAFQALKRWERLLTEIASLGFDDARVSYATFVTVLERYANEIIFAPESHNAPIQILSALESSGQSFDATWFLGADDTRWPPLVQPHPLLPQWLQLQTAMPHTSAEVDWHLARVVTARIAATSSECVFSYAQRDDSGALRPSALLAETFGPQVQSLSSEDLRAQLGIPSPAEHRRQTVRFEDNSVIPWPQEQDAGGADILKRQSACPFQAFAVYRLGAEELDSLERGLTPIDRGNILHLVLNALWSKDNDDELRLQTRDDLVRAKVAGRLAPILNHHIDHAFLEHEVSRQESAWSSGYLQVERERLHLLLTQWLDYESEREPFTVIECEQKRAIDVDGLKLNLRIDRVDEVQSGRLILDYKSGKVSPAMWRGARPEEPQLPFYGVHGGVDELRAVLVAEIRSGDLGFSGHATNAAVTVTKYPDLQKRLAKPPLDQELLGEWAQALKALAGQFLAGDAAVAPRDYPKTCAYCALPALCRVAETSVVLEAEDEEEADSATWTA